MRRYFQGNILIVALVMLSGLCLFLFITTDHLLGRQKTTYHLHYQYLKNKIQLIDELNQNENQVCQTIQQEIIRFPHYSFACQKQSLFINVPTKSYIAYQHISQQFAVEHYPSAIYTIQHLAELPVTTRENPKIVKITDPVDDALPQHFYGIIITDSYFDIKGKYNIYGALYSSYPNKRKERNLSYDKVVIEQLNKMFTK